MGGSKLRKELSDAIHENISVLHRIWCEIGLTKDEIAIRQESIKARVVELFSSVVSEENTVLESAKTQVSQFTQEIGQLRSRLDIKTTKLDDSSKSSGSLISQSQELKAEVDHLRAIADKWRTSFERLATRSKILSDSLGLPSHYLVDAYNESFVPSPWDMDILRHHIEGLSAEERRRTDEYKRLRDRITALQYDLGLDSAIVQSSNTTKNMELQDKHLGDLATRERELLLLKENRSIQLQDMKKTFEVLQKMEICGPEISAEFNFENLHGSNIKLIAKKIEDIQLEMQERKKSLSNDAIGKSQVSVAKQRLEPNRKMRGRSISDSTISSRFRLSAAPLRGMPYRKTTKPTEL